MSSFSLIQQKLEQFIKKYYTSELIKGTIFFFAAGFIYVDKLADDDVRHSAQTVFGIIIFGGGPVIGGWLSGRLQDMNTIGGIFDYSNFWYSLAAIGLITAILFFSFFKTQITNGDKQI